MTTLKTALLLAATIAPASATDAPDAAKEFSITLGYDVVDTLLTDKSDTTPSTNGTQTHGDGLLSSSAGSQSVNFSAPSMTDCIGKGQELLKSNTYTYNSLAITCKSETESLDLTCENTDVDPALYEGKKDYVICSLESTYGPEMTSYSGPKTPSR